MAKTWQDITCMLHIQMKGYESVKYKARKNILFKKENQLATIYITRQRV